MLASCYFILGTAFYNLERGQRSRAQSMKGDYSIASAGKEAQNNIRITRGYKIEPT
jgi:hypothetical protein